MNHNKGRIGILICKSFFTCTAMLFIALLGEHSHAQITTSDATSAPDVSTFGLDAPNLGQIENSVNLFTGDVTLPVNLVSLPSRGGLSMSVSAHYNSNIEDQVDTRNLEAPTGILGLGWSIPIPKIVVDNKSTGTREDDDFYLIEGGTPNQLIYTGATSGTWEFETINRSSWKITYNPILEKWQIIKEDGTKYVYGGTDLTTGSAIEWIIHWKNWIGSSSYFNSATTKRQALAWNISRIENMWGDGINYEYEKVERPIKSYTSVKHTEASYIKKISDPLGRTINFNYGYKYGKQHTHPTDASIEEYVEPHTEITESYDNLFEGDAYQERYEQKYLDYLEVKDESNLLIQIIDFSYGLFGNGDLTKRLLKRILKYNKNDNQYPGGKKFSYVASGSKAGALESVNYLNGASVTYNYGTVEVNHSYRNLYISQPVVGYGEPQIWFGVDYAVVAWRQLKLVNGTYEHTEDPKNVKVYTYSWDGGWKGKFACDISNVKLVGNNYAGYKNFSVQIGKDFYGVMHKNENTLAKVRLMHRNKQVEAGEWVTTSKDLIVAGPDLPTFMSGDNFMALQEDEKDLHTWVFKGNGWRYQEIIQPTSWYSSTGGNNYIISHDRGSSATIRLYYLNKEKEWVTKTLATPFGSNADSHWYASNSFAFVMADDNNEFMYRWDENYNYIARDDVMGGFPDNAPVYMLNNNMVGIAEKNSNTKLARFDGQSWKTTDVSAYYNGIGNYSSIGDDMIVWPSSSNKVRRREFNPNNRSWSSDQIDHATISGDVAEAGNGYYFFENKFFKRSSNGSWTEMAAVSVPSQSINPNKGTWNSYGANLSAYDYNGNVHVYWLKNEDLNQYPTALLNQGVFKGGSHVVQLNHTGPNALVTHYGSQISASLALNLYRLIDDDIEGKVQDYPVTGITVNSGIDSRYIEISYDASTANYSLSEGTKYNKVTITKKMSQGATALNGKTVSYFFNGLPTESLSLAPPTGGNATTHEGQLQGLNYATVVYNKANQEVSKTQTVWNVSTFDIKNSQNTIVNQSYFIRPFKKISTTDGVTTETESSYAAHGLLLFDTYLDNDGYYHRNYYEYFHQFYDESQNNLLTPVISQEKNSITNYHPVTNPNPSNLISVPADKTVTTWKSWNGVYAPYRNFVWKRVASNAFNWWTTSLPNNNWQLINEITSRDTYGNVLETKDAAGINSSVILGYDSSVPIASATNASQNEIAYTSFEAEHSGNWTYSNSNYDTTNAITGKRSYSGSTISKANLPNGEYVLSYWWKGMEPTVSGVVEESSSDGAIINGWNYKQKVINKSGSQVLTIANNDKIDELRLYPSDALMTSSTLDPFIGITSETDANDVIVYTEYDEFGRQILIKDHNQDVVKGYAYNTLDVPDFYLSNHNINFDKTASNFNITVSSPTVWTASVISGNSWLSISPTSGSSSGTLTATVTQNLLETERFGRIEVTGNGLTEYINVSQERGPFLTILTGTVHMAPGNISAPATFQTEESWTANITYNSGLNWLSLSQSSGTGNSTITVSYTPSGPLPDEILTANLNITLSTGLTKTIIVTFDNSSSPD